MNIKLSYIQYPVTFRVYREHKSNKTKVSVNRFNNYVYIYTHTYIYIYIHIYTHTCIYTYIHTYMHIHFCASVCRDCDRDRVHIYIKKQKKFFNYITER